MPKIIIRDVPQADWSLALRAAIWLADHPEHKDAILAYGERKTHFFAKRNKDSITVRPC